MRRRRDAIRLAAGAAAVLLAVGPAVASPSRPRPASSRGIVEETIALPIFGRSMVYRPEPAASARGVVLFVSGDGGWNPGVIDMARRSAARAITVGLSMPAWRRAVEKNAGTCWFPAGELESIAQRVEKTYHLPRYLPPILAGYSSGATLVYGALAQSPAESFAGAVSLGFCPDLEVGRPLCAHGGWKPAYDGGRRRSLLPERPDLPTGPADAARWVVLQGDIDRVCDAAVTARFAGRIPAARLVALPKVGHGFSVPRNWGPAYDAAIEGWLDPHTAWDGHPDGGDRLAPGGGAGAAARRLDDLGLPLEVLWPKRARSVLLFVSGDGGWAELDREVGAGLRAAGIAVVGWNALRYFWEPKSPDVFRRDLARVLDVLPRGLPVFVGGYSFGAEVIPVTLAGHLDRLTGLSGLVLLAPGPDASFEVSPLDWIRAAAPSNRHAVAPAVESLRPLPTLCLEPSDHETTGCPRGAGPGLRRIVMPGGHHFQGDFAGLIRAIDDFTATAPGPRGAPAAAPGTVD